MVMIRFRAQIATNPDTGLPRSDLAGQSGQIVAEGTTTAVPIWEDAGKTLAITGSSLMITANAFVPQFYVEDTYELDWWDGTNRVPIESNYGSRVAAQEAAAAAEALEAGITDAVNAVAAPLVQAAQDAADSAAAASSAAGGDVSGAVALYLAAHPPTAAWPLAGTPATFTPSPHSHVSADVTDATDLGRNILKGVSAAAIRTLIGAGTSNQNFTVGTSAGTIAAGDHTHTQYLTDAQVDTKIAAAGSSGGVGNTVTIFGATTARVNPRDGSALPSYVSVQWVASTSPVNFIEGRDTWLNVVS